MKNPDGHLLMLGVADGADGISLWANYTDNTSVIATGIANAMLRDDRVREIIKQTIIAHALRRFSVFGKSKTCVILRDIKNYWKDNGNNRNNTNSYRAIHFYFFFTDFSNQ